MLQLTRRIYQEVGTMLKIELKFKDKILKHIETDKSEITIGRGTNNDIQIDNLGVSKTHAKIIKNPDAYTVVDLNSTNGTILNDKQIKKAKLAPQDILIIGKHTLSITSIDEVKAPVEDLADKTIKVSTPD
jgi:pSer/pThr/pTyr-binding forkhead associated (FHA) protein